MKKAIGATIVVLGVVVVALVQHNAKKSYEAKLRAEDPPRYVVDAENHRIRLHDFSHHDPPSAATPYQMPCTSTFERTNFPYFSLGPSFEGMHVTDMERSCLDGATKRLIRINQVAVGYGTCRPAPGATGCTLPIDLQSFPACQKSLSQYQSAPGTPAPHGALIRWKDGAISVEFNGGTTVDVYTGSSTLTIFGHDPEQVARSLEAVREEPPGNRVHPPVKDPGHAVGIDALPPPAPGLLQGKVRCPT